MVQSIYENEKPHVFQDQGINVYIHADGAECISPTKLKIGEDVIIAKNTIIATGSSPRIAPPSGGQMPDVLTNNNFWDLRELPQSIVFLGGGVVSVELGQSLARFGSQVRIIEQHPQILHVTDEQVGELASVVLHREGVAIFTNTQVVDCMTLENGQVRLFLDQIGERKEMVADPIFHLSGVYPILLGWNARMQLCLMMNFRLKSMNICKQQPAIFMPSVMSYPPLNLPIWLLIRQKLPWKIFFPGTVLSMIYRLFHGLSLWSRKLDMFV